MRKLSIAAAVLAGLSFISSPLAMANEGHVHKSDADISIMEPSTWFKNAPNGGYTMKFNPAHPAGWAVWLNPKTHTAAHMAFSNPGTYAQFMTPQFYMQFMNPKNWLAWFTPSSYATYLDPNTYAYWLTPHAYVHALNPENYLQMFSGAAYTPYVTLDTYTSWFDLDSYNLLKDPEGIVEGGAGGDYVAEVLSIFGFGGDEEAAEPVSQN